ncbi:MAG TPA: CDP-diacylglycerol--glycerol-3-phosphate 3-phosphatidyltransferase [Burkholderiales bacterium]|nr:CDP-diacylglycerol--glycerol-3-phosphate 3-phosphatidyltransferase [Burkholderiales bacterium]
MPLNVPNLLTWLRIVMIPVVIGVFYVPDAWLTSWQRNLIATSVFIVAAITDLLDGYLARKLNQTSAFGAFLDPVADKLMIAASLIVLVELERANAIIAFVIIGREIAISAMREWMAKIGQSKSVAVNFLGKVKTISQMIAVPMLLYHDSIGPIDVQRIGTWLIYVAAILTLVSMFNYLQRAMAPRPPGDRRRSIDRRGAGP